MTSVATVVLRKKKFCLLRTAVMKPAKPFRGGHTLRMRLLIIAGHECKEDNSKVSHSNRLSA